MRLGEGAFHENDVKGAGGDVVFFDWLRRERKYQLDSKEEYGIGSSVSHMGQHTLLSEIISKAGRWHGGAYEARCDLFLFVNIVGTLPDSETVGCRGEQLLGRISWH